MHELQPGQTLGRYRILSSLGRGGQGVVYVARDTRLDRDVALKLLPAEQSADITRREWLLAEARAAARLSHPGIATIYDVGEVEGRAFIAMELVQGKSLRSILDEALPAGLSMARALDYARQAASALALAHASGFVHRDIKPDNLLVTPEGRIKVLDFGLAIRREGAVELPARQDVSSAETLGTPALADAMAGAGHARGTPAYMAPEQAGGLPLDARADVFALGSLLYEMLCGRAPFARATTEATLRAVLTESPAPLPDAVPGPIAAVVTKALARDREARFADAAEMSRALDAAAPERGAGWSRLGVTAAAIGIVALAIVAIAAAVRLTGRDATGVGGVQGRAILSPVLVRPGVDTGPSISPDGTRMVFSREGDLYVLSLAGTGPPAEPEPLTRGEPIDTQPAWSPDGDVIAFTRATSGGSVEIWKVSAGGGEADRVVLQASSPAWSPDAARLAFVQRGLGRSTSILTVQADGRYSREVTRPEEAFFHGVPAWSPDGETIAFVKDPGGGSSGDIWLAPAAGGPARQLTMEPDGIYANEPAWTPDGRHIVYASNRGGTRNIWRIAVPGGEPERLTVGPGDDGDPAVSPDGRTIYFSTQRSSTGLYVMDLASGAPRALVTDRTGQPWGPDVSPDGTMIAYTRIDRSGPWDIYVVPAAGGAPRRLTEGPSWDLWPRWSPDGATIAYCTFSKGDDDIFVIPAEGGAPRRLTEGDGDDWWPDWTPDGRWIVFSRTTPDGTRLFRVSPDGGPPEILSDWELTLPSVSPDGRYVAVARNRSYSHGVGLLPIGGDRPGRLRWLSDRGGWPVFRPDGKAVGMIQIDPGGRQTLWEVPVGGGEPRPLAGPTFVSWNWPFDYAPDGSSIVYSNDFDLESDLWSLRIE